MPTIDEELATEPLAPAAGAAVPSPGPARRAGRTVCAAVVVALVAAPTAHAQWSAPATVSARHDAISEVQVAGSSGAALLTWHHADLAAPARTIFGPAGASYSTTLGEAPFPPERPLPAAFATGPSVNLGLDSVAQLILRPAGAATTTPEVALGSVNGDFAKPLVVKASVWSSQAGLAGNGNRELLLAWIAQTPAGRQVWASVRPPFGQFGKPQLLAGAATNAQSVTVAVGASMHADGRGGLRSEMLVAFANGRRRMLARVRSYRAGASWGPTQNLGPAATGHVNEVAARIGGDGRIVVAWFHHQLSEGGEPAPGYVQVAVEPRGSQRFLPAQTLQRDPSPSLGGQPVVLSPGLDRLAVAFVGQTAAARAGTFTHSQIEVSYTSGTRFGAPAAVSPQNLQATQLAGGEWPGGAVLAWSASVGTPFSASEGGPIQLSPGPAIYTSSSEASGGRFAQAIQASPFEAATAPVIGYSPTGSRWILAYTASARTPASLTGPKVVRVVFCRTRCS